MTRGSTKTHAPGANTSPARGTSSPPASPTPSPCGSSASTSWSAFAAAPRHARTDTAGRGGTPPLRLGDSCAVGPLDACVTALSTREGTLAAAAVDAQDRAHGAADAPQHE